MTALNQLIIGLLMVVVTANIGNVQGKCTPIKLNVKAEYSVSSLLTDYKHTRDISSSSSFQRNYDSLDVAATVSGSYGGFSGSASASFSEVSETETSNSRLTDKTRTTKVTYSKGQNHVVQVITKTVTINGRSKTVVSREIRYPVLVKDSPSLSQLRKKGEEYIQYNYGGLGGKIRRNTYEATACIAEPCEDDNRVFPFWVTQKEAQGFEVISAGIFGGIPLKCDTCSQCTRNTAYDNAADVFCKDTRVKRRCKKSCGKC